MNIPIKRAFVFLRSHRHQGWSRSSKRAIAFPTRVIAVSVDEDEEEEEEASVILRAQTVESLYNDFNRRQASFSTLEGNCALE